MKDLIKNEIIKYKDLNTKLFELRSYIYNGELPSSITNEQMNELFEAILKIQEFNKHCVLSFEAMMNDLENNGE